MMNKKTIALYVHIPFCVRKCLYCDFLSEKATGEVKLKYLEAMRKEMECWRLFLGEEYMIRSIFLGGGTPTALDADLYAVLLEMIATVFGDMFSDYVEYSTEANPGTITISHIQHMKTFGINRVSLGLQSANDDELRALGRIHSFKDFLESYEKLRMFDINNINIDLMADIPGQSIKSYENTLKQAVRLKPEHISSYSLMIEEGTVFYDMHQQGKLSIPSEEEDRAMYEYTKEFLLANGYERYEISNYAKKGFECVHNITYWTGEEYLGIGLGASSYIKGFRFQNQTVLSTYVERWGDVDYFMFATQCLEALFQNMYQDSLFETEVHHLSEKEKIEEYVFLGFRMMKGISETAFKMRFGRSFAHMYQETLDKYISLGYIKTDRKKQRFFLSDRGIDISNTILAEFLL